MMTLGSGPNKCREEVGIEALLGGVQGRDGEVDDGTREGLDPAPSREVRVAQPTLSLWLKVASRLSVVNEDERTKPRTTRLDDWCPQEKLATVTGRRVCRTAGPWFQGEAKAFLLGGLGNGADANDRALAMPVVGLVGEPHRWMVDGQAFDIRRPAHESGNWLGLHNLPIRYRWR